jgi:hypothetical protein
VPELTSTVVGPGSRISGYVLYQIPDDVAIDDVFFAPEQGVLLTVADVIPGDGPGVGTPVTMAGADEGASLVATAKSVDDPYKGFKKGRGPVNGARFVMTTISFENTGSIPFRVERFGVLLRDANGNLWAQADIEPAKKLKVPVLQSVDLSAGNLVTGRVGFQVPRDVDLEGLYLQAQGRLVQLVDFQRGDGVTPGTGAVGCEELRAWWAQVGPLMQRLLALPYFQEDAAPMDLAASQAALAELESITAAHLAIAPGEGLAEAHRRFLAGFLLYEESARSQVASQEAADPSMLTRSGEAFEAAQIVMREAVAALTPLGYGECIGG